MRGRKLFVWGQGSGGDNWQKYLSGDGCDGRYVEIQAGLAQIHACKGDYVKASGFMLSAWAIGVKDASLTKECILILLKANKNEQVINLVSACPKDIQKLGRVQPGLAIAYLKTGNIDAAEEMLYCDGGLSVPDIREGENSVTDIFIQLEQAKAARDGRAFNLASIKIPPQFDFRMSSTTD